MNTTRKTMSIFWRENWRHPKLFIPAVFGWLIGMVMQKLLLAFIISRAINKLLSLHAQNPHMTDYWHVFAPYLWAFAGVALFSQVFTDLGLITLSKLETQVRAKLQNQAFRWLTAQSLDFHGNTFSGALVTQVNRFTAAYVVLTDNFVLTMMKMFTSVGIAIGIIAFFAPAIALAMAVWTVVFALVNFKLTKKRMAYSKAAAAADSVLTAHLADAMGNIAAVKAFGNEDNEHESHSEKAWDRSNKKYRAWMMAVRSDLLLGLMMALLQFVVLALSIVAVMRGSIEVGTLLLIQVYIAQIMSELWGLSNLSRTIEQALTDAEEMTEIFEIDPSIKDPAKPQAARINKGAIAFNNVSFTHDGNRDALFDGFSLDIKPGEKIGLVGHSGSGKTTLTRLLLRFSDIDGGEITIDAQRIDVIRQTDLRKHIAYVPQEPLLFHRSLRENIAYGKVDATEAEIVEAASQAYATEFIDKLPDKYETLVGERGVKLSGGQRQRIAIARAILKDAPILVLDEATSALDSESEQLIQSALKKLMKHRTTIVIAHRLSTIQKMDRIVVMDDGRIVEQGSHNELLKKQGAYAQLWARQSGGFIEE